MPSGKTSFVRAVGAIAAVFASALLAQTNGVLREVYYNISGGTVAALTNSPNFPNSPSEEFVENAFEAPSNFADNYGQRMRALAVPPVTGSYVFWIASDDNSVLYLSTDENPAHKVPIASESSWTSSRAWNTHASQKSAPVTLTSGLRYYIEALQAEGGGGDNLAVTWQRPGDPAPADGAPPIPGTYLVPYGLGPPLISSQPTNTTVVEGGGATFTVQLARNLGAVFQWQRGATDIPGATNSSYFISPVSLSDNNSTFHCFIVNAYGSTNSAAATLSVTPDLTRPTLASVGSLGDPQILTVIYSEPVETATATAPTSYTLDNGVGVVSAAFGIDTRTVVLTTTPMATKTTYTLTVNNVRDRATTPNTILPNTQRTFSLDSTPLDISFVRPPLEPIGPSTRHGPVVISEIMYHPTTRVDGKNLEFVELFNSNPYFEDLSGFRLTGDVDFTFPSNTVLAARSYLAIASVPADLQSVYSIVNVTGPYTNKLSNSAGTLRLLNRQGGIVFDVSYASDPPWPAAADGAGHSLVLARASLGERNPDAWAASDAIGGSPGLAEPIGANPYRTVVINEFLAHTDPPELDYVELFNYSSSPVDLSGCVLTDDPSTNRFVITNVVIQPQDFVYFDETKLGFRLNAAGETIYFKDPNNTRVIDAVRYGAQQNGVATGRYPDGAASFHRLQTITPGAKNDRLLVPDVVINEIMYDPISGDSDDQYVELYNRTVTPVDVSHWSLTEGIKYTLPASTIIPGGGYLVVAKNAAHLMTNYSNLSGANTVGDFSGKLAHGGDRVGLAMPDEVAGTNAAGTLVTNIIHIVVDDVAYGVAGRWGKWAHGGGSSLESIDARSDHRLAPNWADSDETTKSGWTNIEFTGVLDNGGDTPDSLQIILLGPGECLVDNVEVIPSGGSNLIPNSDFEGGLTGWVPQGNHEDSSLETGEGYNSAHCLHIRATDRGDTGANRIRVKLTSSLSSGQTATLRAKVRWLKGYPEILLRLKGNWLEATGNILTARNLGTPGAPNSQARSNVGPAITAVKHSPVVPTANQTVTVVARVHDSDGLASLVLKYRIDPSTNLTAVSMANNGAGLFSAVIPGQTAGTLVAFHIQASDNYSPSAATLFPNDAPARECLVRWGDPAQGGSFGTYRLWMTQATLNRWSNREHLSNKPLDCTFVYGNNRVIYNMGGEYSGSPYHAPGFNSPIGNVCDYLVTFPDDDPLLGETDATLQWPGNGGGDNSYQREQTAYWIANQIGLPYCYRRHVNLFINGVRRAEMYEDVQQPNGDMSGEFYPNGVNGDLHKVQLWFEFDDAASSFDANGATLQSFTTTGGRKKLARYRWTFAKRAVQDSASNYTNLFALVDAVNFSGLGANYRRQLEATLEVDNWLKTYAVEHIVGNNDSFAFGGGQNMYAYKPAGDTWKMMIWDIDFAFASLGPTGDDMFAGIGRSNGIDLGEAAYRRRYWQILQDLANGPLVAATVNPLLNAKYNAMVANGRTVDNPTAIQSYLSQRRTYLLGLIATNANATFSITLNNDVDFSTGQSPLLLTGTAPIAARSIVINGVVYPVTWTSISNWNALVVLSAGTNTLTVQGRDSQGNVITGANATIRINYTGAVEQPEDKLVINEIMYHPAAPNASFVEIYNTSTVSGFDLSGWRLNGVDFTFPAGAIIPAGGFLVIAEDRFAFAAAYGKTIPVVGEFSGQLQNNGETLRLIKPGMTPDQDVIADEVRYESTLPWPAAADGTGASLQLIDPAQDDNRVANWGAVPTNSVPLRARYTPGAANSLRSTLPAIPPLWLNEVLPENLSGATDRFGHRHPWAELYNGGPTNLDLGGLYLANNYSNLTQWPFPAGTTIGAGQFLQVWLDGNPGESIPGELHTSFTVPPAVGSLALVTTAGVTNVLDYLNYAVSTPDRSYGSFPDGKVSGRQVFYYVTPGGTNNPAPPPLNVFINEWMADNVTTLADPADNDFEDWFELYNPGETTADLSGFYLGTSLTNKTEFRIPDGYTIPPHGFLLVWADGESSQNSSNQIDLHASFKLSKLGDAIGIFASDGTVVDFVSFGPQTADVSEGGYPDGSTFSFTLTTPTPRGANFLATSNTPPSVVPIADQVVIEGQLLLLNVTATDADAPAQNLSFNLDPGAPAGATINPASGLFSWRPTPAQTPDTNRITARVTDDGAPPMSAETTFLIRVAPRPQVTSITTTANGGYAISFVTVTGKTYRVDYKDSLNDSVWSPLNADVIASGNTLTVNDDSGSTLQRFYRITVLD